MSELMNIRKYASDTDITVMTGKTFVSGVVPEDSLLNLFNKSQYIIISRFL